VRFIDILSDCIISFVIRHSCPAGIPRKAAVSTIEISRRD
jgi:hypothetical protein